MDVMGRRILSPSITNNGQIRSSTVSRFSLTNLLVQSHFLLRRGRWVRSSLRLEGEESRDDIAYFRFWRGEQVFIAAKPFRKSYQKDKTAFIVGEQLGITSHQQSATGLKTSARLNMPFFWRLK
jgi:hypothetical protein